jgi:hypothetical protein
MRTLQSSNEASDTTNLDDWSDRAMWCTLLEGAEARSQRATISNMLEYMGASDWFDRQLQREQGGFPRKITGKRAAGRVVGEKFTKSRLLDRIQGLTAGTSMKGVGRLSLEEVEEVEEVEEGHNSSDAKADQKVQRRRILMHIARGRRLRKGLVGELGFGILFHPHIW